MCLGVPYSTYLMLTTEKIFKCKGVFRFGVPLQYEKAAGVGWDMIVAC